MDESQKMRSRFNKGAGGLICGPVFLVLALWFAFGPNLLSLPKNPIVEIDKARISTAARRKILSDPPVMFINATDKNCMDCHQIMFKPDVPKTTGFLQHKEIKLSHAINTNCYDCHDKEDRNSLVKRNGQKLSFDDVVQLCRQCHGSIYDAWTYGGHGRTNGYWDADKGPQHKLKCTECHNPHSPRTPAMDPIQPLPGPNTLRMGKQDPEGHTEHDPIEDPLRKAMLRDQHQKAAHRSGMKKEEHR